MLVVFGLKQIKRQFFMNSRYQNQFAMLKIVAVENASQRKSFMMLPWKIYKDNPYWVPPLIMDLKKMFNTKKHPFYDYGTMQLFLVYKNEELVGRIAAITNSRYDEFHKRSEGKTGFFGFFECNWNYIFFNNS